MINENKHWCDHQTCKNEPAVYTDGKTEICLKCTNEVLDHLFDKLSPEEKMSVMGWSTKNIVVPKINKAKVRFNQMPIEERIHLLDLDDKLLKIKE